MYPFLLHKGIPFALARDRADDVNKYYQILESNRIKEG